MDKKIKKYNNGFTLIEMLIVISVIGFLSAGVVLYGSSSRVPIALFQEQNKIISELNQAKALTLQFFDRDAFGPGDCGYGVHFDVPQNSVWIYKNKKSGISDVCNSTSTHSYAYNPATDETRSKFELTPPIKLGALDFTDVVFIAPNARAYMADANGSIILNQPEGYYQIEISAGDSGKSVKVKINNYGQISAF